MNTRPDQPKPESLMSDPEALVQWCLENKRSLAKVLQEQGMSAEEAKKLISRADFANKDAHADGRGNPAGKSRGKFYDLKEAQPTPMTDAEYVNVLRGHRRDGS